MFQLQHSLGSTEGLPSLVATARSSPLSSLLSVLPQCQVKQLFPLHVLVCALPADHTPAPGEMLLPSPFVAAEERGTLFKSF